MLLMSGHLSLWQKLCFITGFWIVCMTAVQAQSGPLGTWTILNGKVVLDKRWNVFAEGQVRSVRFYDDFFYFEIKGGLNYNLNENISVTIGTGRYQTYNTTERGNFVKPLALGEIRTWVQLAMEQYLDRVNFEHRYRAEQRFTTDGYRNRFRYRINVFFPINHRDLIPKTIYASVSNELFFTDKAPYYERNRFFAGFGYKVSSLLVVQAGYMRQFDYKIENPSRRQFLQTSFLYSFTLKDDKDASMPSSVD